MIHQFQCNGYSITLDIFSGSIHLTDDATAEAIRLRETMPQTEAMKALRAHFPNRPDVTTETMLTLFSAIDQLEKEGKLYTRDVFKPYASHLSSACGPLKALCLHVAHTCNLNCSYCFASQGKYQGDNALMSLEVGKRAVDFLVERSGGRTNLEVDFFGGEPLMNWHVVKRLVAYGRSLENTHNKRFRFTLTTNGVLLNEEVTDFCNREMHNVVLSLDGRKEVHDRFRRDHMNRGSYDKIVPKFQEFVKSRGDKNYYIRGTFTHHNTDFSQDLLHMADLGFTELSMEPVVTASDDPCALTEDDLPVLFEQYEFLAAEMLRRTREGRPFTFYHYMLDLERGPCVYKRMSGCGSGTEYLAVSPWGELYPCHQFVGEPAYSMGNIWQGIENATLQDNFRQCNVYSRPACSDCWAKLFCAGGCAANAYHASGNINGVYDYGCRLFRKRIECAIMLQAALTEENE